MSVSTQYIPLPYIMPVSNPQVAAVDPLLKVTSPQEESHFLKGGVQGAEMTEDGTTLIAQTGPDFKSDSEFPGFNPDDINGVLSLT